MTLQERFCPISNDFDPDPSEFSPPPMSNKYIIQHADGRPVDPDAVYYVLRIDNYKDKPWRQACRAALAGFAGFIHQTHKEQAVAAIDLLEQTHQP